MNSCFTIMKRIFFPFVALLMFFSACSQDDFQADIMQVNTELKQDTIWLAEYNPNMPTRSVDGTEPYAVVTYLSSTSRQYELYGIPVVVMSNYQQGFSSGGENLIPAGYYICDRWLISARMPTPVETFNFIPDLSQAGWSGQTPGNPQTRDMSYTKVTVSDRTYMDVKSFCYEVKSDMGGGSSYPQYLPINPNDVVLRFVLSW